MHMPSDNPLSHFSFNLTLSHLGIVCALCNIKSCTVLSTTCSLRFIARCSVVSE